MQDFALTYWNRTFSRIWYKYVIKQKKNCFYLSTWVDLFSPLIWPKKFFQNKRWTKKNNKGKKGFGRTTFIISNYLTHQKGFNWICFTNFKYAKINLKNILGKKKKSATLTLAKNKTRKCSPNVQFTQWPSLFDFRIKIKKKNFWSFFLTF